MSDDRGAEQPARDDLAERLRALCDGATPGPWNVDGPSMGFGAITDAHGALSFGLASGAKEEAQPEDACETNAAFIAAARTAVPELLDALAARDQQIAELERKRDDARAVIVAWEEQAERFEKDAEDDGKRIAAAESRASAFQTRVSVLEGALSDRWLDPSSPWSDRGLMGEIMDRVWEDAGGNHQDAAFYEDAQMVASIAVARIRERAALQDRTTDDAPVPPRNQVSWAHDLRRFLLREFGAAPESGESVTADVRPYFDALCGFIARHETAPP